MRGSYQLKRLHTLRPQPDQQINRITKANPYPSKKTHEKRIRTKNIPPPAGDSDIRVWNISISTHMRDARLDAALRVFSSMPRRSSVSYNAMISGYLMNGELELAWDMFEKMPERDLVSWNVMLSGFVRNGKLAAARQLFEWMPERDVVSWNAMLSGYAQNGWVDEARKVFDRMTYKNEISWNALLSSYVQNGRIDEACRLFESKADWEIVSWNCLMGGFVKKRRLADARQIFNRMPFKDEVSWNIIITAYAQNGDIEEARRLFHESPQKDVFTWTAMVSGYVQNRMVDEARNFFEQMPAKNVVSWNAMIAGYVQDGRIDMARELFEEMTFRNVTSWNTMITGYAQNGEIAHARNLFDRMPRRDPISWAAMISGYSQAGFYEEVLHLLVKMKRDGAKLNRSSFACAMSTCANIGALELGKQLHGGLVKAGIETGTFSGNALLLMYCRCGSIEDACAVFEGISEKDVVSWNTMVGGYARHGFGEEALRMFESMKTVGTKPDGTTMVAVLSACSHAGLVDRGTKYFQLMNQDYSITANSQHYTCMVDLLGRAGKLDEAQNLIRDMPFEPDAATWGALLGASRVHRNMELAEKAANIIFEMEPENAGMYVLLANLYAASGRWADVRRMRLKMKNNGVRKVPGCSWIEAQNKIHTFSVGDSTHPERDKIYQYLEELDHKMKLEGYVSSTELVLHDVDEEEKERMLLHHSEKLAVAYGVLSVPAGRPIRVMKNLRVCEDCHNFIKYISKIAERLVILRDSNRFHHFSEGSCSCGDYW